MKMTKLVRLTLLSAAVVGIVGVAAVLACGPAASAPQHSGEGDPVAAAEDSTATPTATPYPDDCKKMWNMRTGQREVVCPPEGSRKIEHNLRREYNNLMEEKSANQASGATTEVIERDVYIEVTTHDAVDALVDYLRARTTNGVSGYKDPGAGGRVSVLVDIELLPAIAEMDDVEYIGRYFAPAPASLMRQSSSATPTPTMTAVERVRADQWHDAGITGSGVGVAVIDYDFRDFRTRVVNPSIANSDPNKPDVHFFCYRSNRSATHADFSACETPHATPRARPHGTDVVTALLENSPDVTLYISNPSNSKELEQAVDWLTLGESDNSASDTDYTKSTNDDFDVRVINHSQTYVWDGPGDGTSPFFARGSRSPLNMVGDAANRGVVWVNAAGNQNKSTWFDHNPKFDGSSGYLSYSGTTGGPPDCNAFNVDSAYQYTVQLRWSDTWQGADIDLDLKVFDRTSLVGISMDRQSGGSRHHPREVLTFPAGSLSSGQHCIAVVKDPGEDVPDWIQFQLFEGPGDFAIRSGADDTSISNPAESANGGMLAVGAARIDSASPSSLTLQDFSARGPLPTTGHPRKPDVVGLNTDLSGTSFSSPRVAGEVALVVQGDDEAASPTRVAGAVRDHAEHPSMVVSDHEWGHGFARLPSMEAPDIVSVSHDPCTGQAPLRVDYSHPAVGTYPMAFHFEARQVGVQGTGAAAYERIHIGTIRIDPREVYLDTGTDRGSYDVTARACTEAGHCGPESSSPTRFTTSAKVCKPRWFRAVAGDERATLWWNPDPDASGYRIELVGGDPVTVFGTEHVIDGLVNGGLFRYRLQALGPGGPSEWTSPRSVTPRESTSRPAAPKNLRVESNISRRFPGTQLRWDLPLGGYLYEVKVKGGGTNDWERLPFQPAGWDAAYSARFFGGHQRVGESFVFVGDAIVAGLIPGTEYHFAVRAARERNSDSKLDRSPWSDVLTVTTPGVRPADAPGDVAAPALKAPPEDLMAAVSGTTATLTWTAGTNPNYVRQQVWRREVGVTPLDWTKVVVGLTDTSYTDGGLVSGKKYVYRIRAEKSNGKGGVSNAVTVTIP